MATGLTINQERMIRKIRREQGILKEPNPQGLREHDLFREQMPAYRELAEMVAAYRKAQRSTAENAARLRSRLVGEIDRLLEKIGL